MFSDDLTSYQLGKKFYDQKNYVSAFTHLIAAAKQLDLNAIKLLAQMFYAGEGVKKNYSHARDLYDYLALSHDGFSHYRLARIYEKGDGFFIQKNLENAKHHYLLAYKHGFNGARPFAEAAHQKAIASLIVSSHKSHSFPCASILTVSRETCSEIRAAMEDSRKLSDLFKSRGPCGIALRVGMSLLLNQSDNAHINVQESIRAANLISPLPWISHKDYSNRLTVDFSCDTHIKIHEAFLASMNACADVYKTVHPFIEDDNKLAELFEQPGIIANWLRGHYNKPISKSDPELRQKQIKRRKERITTYYQANRKKKYGLLVELGKLYSQKNDYEKSESCFRDAYHSAKFLFSDSHPELAYILTQHGITLYKQKYFTEAKTRLKAAKAIYEKHPKWQKKVVETQRLIDKCSATEERMLRFRDAIQAKINTLKLDSDQNAPNTRYHEWGQPPRARQQQPEYYWPRTQNSNAGPGRPHQRATTDFFRPTAGREPVRMDQWGVHNQFFRSERPINQLPARPHRPLQRRVDVTEKKWCCNVQ